MGYGSGESGAGKGIIMKGPQVLVVDDSLHTRRSLKGLLEGADYLVHEAGNSTEAFRSIRQQRPDAIILDIMLPGRSGLEFSEDLKSLEKYRDIPILIFTGIARKRENEGTPWRGKTLADDFLTKPAKGREILEKVRRLLGRKATPPSRGGPTG